MKKKTFLVAMFLATTVFADENRLTAFWQAPAMNLEQAEKLAKFDLVVVDLENWFNNPKSIALIRQQNSDCKILAYCNPMEFFDPQVPGRPFQATLYQEVVKKYPGWWLNQPSGEPIYYWNSPRMRMLNLSSECPKYNGQTWTDFLAGELKSKLLSLPNKPDGIFVDNAWDDVSWVKDGNLDGNSNGSRDDYHALDLWWQQGMQVFLKKLKATAGLVIGNEPNSFYQNELSGKFFENMPLKNFGGFEGSVLTYTQDLNQLPMNIIHSELKNKEWRMFILTTTLLGEGWFCNGLNHAEWYPEYDKIAKLGQPQGEVQLPHQLVWQSDEINFAQAKEIKSDLLEAGEYLVSYKYQIPAGNQLVVQGVSEQYGGVFPYSQQIHDRWISGNIYTTMRLTAPGRIVWRGEAGTALDLRIWRKNHGPWTRQYEHGQVLVWPDQARGEILLN